VIRIARPAGLLCAAISLSAQPPAIGQNGVFNSASQIAPTLAGGAIARGALFTIHGVRLGSPGHATTVSIGHGKTSTPARIIATRAAQIDALMPLSAPLGPATLIVTRNGEASAPFPIEVVASNPGLFSRSGRGWGPGRIENIDSRGARSANSTANPARPGQRVSLAATGLGGAREITVIIGNRAARASLSRKAAKPGEEELSFRTPAETPEGCYVPVYLRLSSTRASNVVTLSIRSGSGPCEPGPIPILTAKRIGVAILSRTRIRSRSEDAGASSYDEALVTFTALNNGPGLSPLALLPPPGTCTAYTSSFQTATALPNSFSSAFIAELGGTGLDAGSSLTVSRAEISELLRNPNAPGFYARLGNSDRHTGPRRARILLPFLDPGDYTLSGPGGKDVGPFAIGIPGPAPFEWSDSDQIAVVDRSRPLPIHWRGAAADRLIIMLATNVDQITTAIGTCLCAARAGAGQFTIPPALLANLPVSRDMPGIPYDRLFVASLPAKTAPPMKAPGLEGGAVFNLFANGRIVEYR
jgi:uncharacterized protein (TIGR03437 family)